MRGIHNNIILTLWFCQRKLAFACVLYSCKKKTILNFYSKPSSQSISMKKNRKFRVPLPPPPQKSYKLLVKTTGQTIQVDPEKVPYSRHGLPGSILDIISTIDEGLIEHACGGVQACSTCHIYIKKGEGTCNESSEREEDYIDRARAPQIDSRLACCCVPSGDEDIEIEIPTWNINEVKETPH